MQTTSASLDLRVLDRHPDGVLRLRAERDDAGALSGFSCVYANAAARALFHASLDVGAPLVDVLRPDEAREVFALAAHALRSDEPQRRHVGASGDGARLALTVLPEDDGVLVFVEACDDVRRVNRELEARARELKTLLDLVPIAIFVAHDVDCRRITGNRTAAELLGLPDGENLSITGEPTRASPRRVLHDGRQLGPSELPVQRAARGATIRGEQYELVFEDGTKKVIFGYASPLYDDAGNVRGSLAAFLDITDRRLAEAAVERRSKRLQLLWEAARILMTVQDPAVMMRELFGRIAPELKLDVYFGYVVEERAQALRLVGSAGLDDATRAALSSLPLEGSVCGLVARGGEGVVLSDVLASSDPMTARLRALGVQAFVCQPLHAGGKVVGTLAFGSRSKHAFPSDSIEFLQTITRYVAVAYERLRLIEELREADRRKDDFLATLAHELRNPLAPIRNAVEILKLKGPPDPKLVWGRDIIDRQVQHMARLLEDLLDVSRISRDKLELRREPVEIAAVLDVAVETSRPLVDAGKHTLTVDVEPGSLCVDGDPVRLAQVFANLLNNAAKYTPEGGSIVLSARREGADVVVSVKDDGIGIPAETLPRIFEIFAQAQPALRRAQGGLGIGLSLVKGLVELHGGHVVAKSEGPHRGSELVVRLPLMAEDAPRPRPASVRALATATHRVLVVDDNADSADSLALLLELAGCEVAVAYDGPSALAAAAKLEPTAVLLDIGMPGMTGLDVCRRLREEPYGRRSYVVAMTGWGRPEDRAQTREAGFDEHLVKPLDGGALVKMLAARAPFPRR